MSNTIFKLNNFGQVAKYQYDEESDLMGERLTDYGYTKPIWSEVIDNFPSLEINIGALLNIIGLLSKEELIYLIAISKIIIYDPHVFYIGKMNYGYDGNHLCFSISDKEMETIAGIDYISNYLDISQLECLDLLNKLSELNIIKERRIIDKNNEIIYIINPDIFCNSYYLNHDVIGLFKLEEINLTYYDVFYRTFKKLDNGKYILNPNDTHDVNTEVEEIGRNSIEYRKWVLNALERDNYTCQCCESKLNPEVHHILNYAKYKDLRIDMDNAITLCECCHSPMIKGSYHNAYGTRNNNREQLQEYINNKRKELGLEPKTI